MPTWSSVTPRLCLGLVLIGAASAASAQTGGSPPNIHFIVDTSGSMRELPQVVGSDHAQFFNSTTSGCFNPKLDEFQLSHGWNPDIAYPVPDQGTQLGSDSGFPGLFQDDKFYGYMYWGDSSYPTPQWNSREAACQGQVPGWATTGATEYSRCLSCLDLKGYYKVPGTVGRNTAPLENLNFIFRGRLLNINPPKYVTVRAVLKKVISQLSGMRAGMSYFANTTPSTRLGHGQNPSCSQVLNDSSSFDNNRASYINTVNGLTFSTSSTLARSLLNVGYYFTSGDDVYRDTFGFSTNFTYPAEFRPAPLTYQSRSWCWGCQHSAVIVIADGDPSADTLAAGLVTQLRTVNGGPVYCPDSEPCGPYNSRDKGLNVGSYVDDNPQYYLDDVAKLLASKDLQQSTPAVVGDFDTSGRQSLRIHTVGYGTPNNLLKNTAQVGGGLYFTAGDASALEASLTEILNDVQVRSTTCAIQP
jgi:type IV pilus assembly protein PilY1